jgi:predicted nucleic acid-binding Zn ribbon protein
MNFDDWYSARHLEEDYECPECGESVSEEGRYCSSDCFEASML